MNANKETTTEEGSTNVYADLGYACVKKGGLTGGLVEES